MKYTLLAISFLVMSSFAFTGQSAGVGEPKPYPNGRFCTPTGDLVGGKPTKDHPCACKRHDDVDPSDPDASDKGKMCKAGEATNPTHDSVCQQFCSEQHCMCPVACDKEHHQ